ncbi:MAG: LysR family transcriptional regulator, partial [Lysobacter sp.]
MSSRRLPPLGALRAFEAAARLQSFKRAAEELSVTPTAISHQIRALEDQIGVRLFERQTRRVALTAAAERLYPVLRKGFDAFAEAIAELRTGSQRRALTLSATLSF